MCSYKRLLVGATILGRKLMRYAAEGKSVGVMLPSSNAAALTIVGLMSAGRVPAMINFMAGSTNILAACRAADLGTIVTSRAFVDKGNLGPLVDQLARQVSIVYLEDVRKSIGLADKLRGLIEAKTPLVKRNPADPAVILPPARRGRRRASCSRIATSWRTPPRPRPVLISGAAIRSSTCSRCFTPLD
jgi:acyl-[acyl-carrier-protein]-phospholipid O-acyltransferase/long-chain-fatty-acid--[acyl-carrier-protein] ligase